MSIFTALLRFTMLSMVIVAMALFTGCAERIIWGSGNQAAKEISPKPYNAISCSIPMQLHITTGSEGYGLRISGYSNLLSYIQTEVKDSTLRIFVLDGISIRSEGLPLVADITLPALSSIDISGSNTAQVTGNNITNAFTADLSGSCTLEISQLQADRLKTDISGSAHMTVNGGTIHTASYDISGSGVINTGAVQSDEATADISGSGEVTLTATQKLEASVSGSGAVRYAGNPARIIQDISGSGSIRPLK